MAAPSGNWSFADGTGMTNTISLSKNKVSVNGGEEIKLTKLPRDKQSNMLETIYNVGLNSGEVAQIHIKNKNAFVTMNGKNVETGEDYEPSIIPKWAIVFFILYGLNFFLFIGGAVGGAVAGIAVFATASIAANKKKSTLVRVLLCCAVYIVITLVEIALAYAILSSGVFS